MFFSDTAAENLGLPYLSSYLDSLGANFSHGANFATSLSTIIPQNITLAQGGYSPFSLDIQAMQFSQFQSRSQFILRKGKCSVSKFFLTVNQHFKFQYIHRRSAQEFDANEGLLLKSFVHHRHWPE